MYSPAECQIYRYWDGTYNNDGLPTYKGIDPIEVQIRLEEHDPNYQQSFKTLFDMVQISKDADAAKEIVDLGRIMFGLSEGWDDGTRWQGHTTMGVMSVVLDYINWMSDLKKNIEDTPTIVPPTEVQETTSVTNVSLDVGSISQEVL
jgi:hypothetical protein